MSIILDGTTGITTPTVNSSGDIIIVDKIVHSGDTDTGIRFPVADTVTVQTNNVERFRVDNSGNVGIGTSSPLSSLDVAGVAPTLTIKDTQNKAWTSGDNLGAIDFYSVDASGSGPRTVARIQSFADATASTAAGALAFWTSDKDAAATEKVRITSLGNVGIGTASPAERLTILSGANNSTVARFTGAQAARGLVISTFNSGGPSFNDGGVNLQATEVFSVTTAGTERMRIDSSGNLLLGKTAPTQTTQTGWTFTTGSAGEVTNTMNTAGLANTYHLYNINATNPGYRFYVGINGGISNFSANNTNLSDERAKTDIAPLGSYWDKIKALQVVTYKYRSQGHDDNNIGVIAQQVESVAPEFVSNDGFGELPADGVPLKSIYETDLHYATLRALQEAMA